MTRRHPQTANAPEAKRVIGWDIIGAKVWTKYSDGSRRRAPDIKAGIRIPRYGRGALPWEGFTLTDAQLEEWKRDPQ